jgi:hypothetical protein
MNKAIFNSINENFHNLPNKRITLGFDGFIDIIYKVIRSKDDQHAMTFFNSIQEFGGYITEKGEKNFSLEVEKTATKIGGNMPIMANALAQFGSMQRCLGALGYPSIDPVFEQMPSNCELFSFAEPGLTKALEFNGNKIMLAEIGSLNTIEWNAIKNIVGLEMMIRLFSKPDMVCLLNWSELDNSTALWKGLLKDILPQVPPSGQRPIGFFDFADCSKRTADSITEALDLLKSFSKYWDIVLSLNLNEATIVHRALNGDKNVETNIDKIGEELYRQLKISNVIIHYSRQALSWDATGCYRADSFYVDNPAISTGAGDNFNAGYCAGLLMGLPTKSSLLLGHAASNFYMARGKSPTIPDILLSLSDKLNLATPININS